MKDDKNLFPHDGDIKLQEACLTQPLLEAGLHEYRLMKQKQVQGVAHMKMCQEFQNEHMISHSVYNGDTLNQWVQQTLKQIAKGMGLIQAIDSKSFLNTLRKVYVGLSKVHHATPIFREGSGFRISCQDEQLTTATALMFCALREQRCLQDIKIIAVSGECSIWITANGEVRDSPAGDA